MMTKNLDGRYAIYKYFAKGEGVDRRQNNFSLYDTHDDLPTAKDIANQLFTKEQANTYEELTKVTVQDVAGNVYHERVVK